MDSKDIKYEILKTIMNNNPNNNWVSLDYIISYTCTIQEYIPSDTVFETCEELVKTNVLNGGVVTHFVQVGTIYEENYYTDIRMYKIQKEYIEKFRNVIP